MPISIFVLKETKPDEKRVAMVPSVTPRLAPLGAMLRLPAGAGVIATFGG